MPTIISSEPVLRDVLDELVKNAVTHVDCNPRRIRVSARVVDDRVTLSVTDNGPGLPAEKQEALRTGIETPLEHTSGLGLWLVTWGITSIGGEVRFDEGEGGGLRVEIVLPLDASRSASLDGIRMPTISAMLAHIASE